MAEYNYVKHKDLTQEHLHVPKIHAPTHEPGGTDPLTFAISGYSGYSGAGGYSNEFDGGASATAYLINQEAEGGASATVYSASQETGGGGANI
jgi:hypothetical protein